MMKPLAAALAPALLLAAVTLAQAKLPAPSDEAKAKAAEAAARTAWAGKVSDYQLCKAQDKVAADHQARAKKAGQPASAAVATPPCADPGPFVYLPPGAASAPAAAPSAPAAAAKKKA